MALTPSITHISDLPESFAVAVQDETIQQKVLDDLVGWFYSQVLKEKRKNLLVRVHECFDLSALEEACQAFHCHEEGSAGQGPTYTIGQLCRALLVKYLFDWSYRTATDEITQKLIVRWFVGYPLYGPVLSYSTLRRFELWVKIHCPRIFFNTILRQIDEDFPAEQKKAQAGDTYAMFAVVNAQSRTELLRTSSQKLLNALQECFPAIHTILMSQMDEEALFGKKEAPREAWLDIKERKALEERTALAAAIFLRQVEKATEGLNLSANAAFAEITLWQSVLDKALGDEFKLTQDEKGCFLDAKLLTAQERKKKGKEKSTYRYGSTLDLEASFRNHGKSNDFGYNISIAATDNFIREIAAATGATPDASGIPLLLTAQQENLGTLPPKLVYDKAAGHAKYFHQVDQVTDGQTQLIAKLIDNTKNSDRFGPKDFTLHENGLLTCPEGQSTSKGYRADSRNGWDFRFGAELCQGCRKWHQCRPDSQPESKRAVFVSD